MYVCIRLSVCIRLNVCTYVCIYECMYMLALFLLLNVKQKLITVR